MQGVVNRELYNLKRGNPALTKTFHQKGWEVMRENELKEHLKAIRALDDLEDALKRALQRDRLTGFLGEVRAIADALEQQVAEMNFEHLEAVYKAANQSSCVS